MSLNKNRKKMISSLLKHTFFANDSMPLPMHLFATQD